MPSDVALFRRKFFAAILFALALVIPLSAQPFSTQIQIAINQLTTGVTPFTQLALAASSYISWGNTLGVNGYGFRDNAGVVEFKNSGGSWIPVASATGAPADAGYWVRTATAGLTNETIMGALGTGLVINTTTTGVPTIYAGVSCTNQFLRALSAIGASTCASVTLTSDVSGILPVANGGTGLASGTSGGVPYYSAAGVIASSSALSANQLVVGGGAGLAPAALGSLGTTTTVLHGNAAGAPSFAALVLTTDVSGILPGANGGTANGFFAVSGPTTSLKTFAFPDASATVLTSNAAVTAGQGGTGISSYTIGDLIYASGAAALSKLAGVATGNVVISGGVATAPSWGKVGLTTHVSGTLPVANGGTNIASYTIGDLLYASGATALSKLASPASGFTIRSTGVGAAPVWDSPAIRIATVTLTDAQIKALPTTPIQLVAAPGASLRIVPTLVTISLDATGGAYTNVSAVYSDLHLKPAGGGYWSYVAANDSSLTTPLDGLSDFIGTLHEATVDIPIARTITLSSAATGMDQYNLPQQVGSFAAWENVAFQIFADNSAGGDFTGGDSANTMTVRTYYYVQAVP